MYSSTQCKGIFYSIEKFIEFYGISLDLVNFGMWFVCVIFFIIKYLNVKFGIVILLLLYVGAWNTY